MKVYVNTSFKGHYPAGTAAVVFANSQQEAVEQLNAELQTVGLSPTAILAETVEINPVGPSAYILNDGDY